MFQENISQTPLTGAMADAVFRNISGSSFGDDNTFLSTLRMALYGRIPEDESLYLDFHGMSRSYGRYRSADDISNAIGEPIDNYGNGRLSICYLEIYDQEDNKKIMDFIDSNFTGRFEGWQRMQKVTDLFRVSFRVSCFYNETKKSTILFVERMNMRILHLMQSGIVGYLPWYFSLKKGECDDVVELVYSVREKTPDRYMNCIRRFAEQFDFRTEKIRMELAGYENVALKERLSEVERQIESIMGDIRSYNDTINDLMNRKFEYDIIMTGVQTKLSSGDVENETMDYFLANKNLVLERVRGSELRFGVKTYIEYFENDALKSALKNEHSFVYSGANSKINKEMMKKLMTAIFIDNKLRVRSCGTYMIDVKGRFEAFSRVTYADEYSGYLPNPHIDEYACLGNHTLSIRSALNEHNYIGAIEQCISSAKSLNFNDAPVMRVFMDRMYNYRGNVGFIEAPDGQLLKPIEAIEWLNANSTEG